MLKFTLAQFCDDHAYLTESEKVTEEQKRIFRRLNDQTASLTDVQGALLVLMKMMRAYYGKPIILLLDEYDVPIAKASANGYYTEMLEVIRGMMSAALERQRCPAFCCDHRLSAHRQGKHLHRHK
ncbi:MAG: AAA family ATPase [Evtepia sp.]